MALMGQAIEDEMSEEETSSNWEYDPARRLKRTKSYGKRLARYDKKLLAIEQAIYDLGVEFEGDLPESRHGGLVYGDLMRLDKMLEDMRAHLNGLVSRIADLDIDDC